jgi:DNA-directed RNA polymerase specialized sigma24 family protein
MSDFGPEPERLHESAKAEVVRLYERHRGLLLRLLTRKYGVPADDAEGLVHEAFTAVQMEQNAADAQYTRNAGRVEDPEKWLIAAVSLRGEAYRREHGVAAAPASTPDEKPSHDAAICG